MALNARSSQEFVPIKEIQDGIIILKDGGFRAVLMASSVNISLKSEDEQNAIIMQFQNFLNSLDFSVQISIQSRKYDVTGYLATLEERLKEQTEPLLKIQTAEYIQYIQKFTEDINIMTKHFFVIVPYNPVVLSTGGIADKIFPTKKKEGINKDEFEAGRNQLEQRVSLVEQGLSRVGVRVAQLKTDEVVELFYKVFNPGEAESKINFSSRQ